MSKQSKITIFFNNKNFSFTNKTDKVKNERDVLENINGANTGNIVDVVNLVSDDDDDEEKDIKIASDAIVPVQKISVESLDVNTVSQEKNNESLDTNVAFHNLCDDTDDVDQLLLSGLLEYESKSDESLIHNSDYATVFFSKTVEEFLSQQSLHYLFTEIEITMLNQFSKFLSDDHKKLFVRMYWLQWKWHKATDMISKYLNSIDQNENSKRVIEFLKNKEFLQSGVDVMNFDDWASVLRKNDLVKICKHFKLPCSGDKSTLLESLKKFCSTKSSFFRNNSKCMEKSVFKTMYKEVGECIKITESSKFLFDRLHLLMYLGANPAFLRDKQLNLLLLNIQNGRQFFPTDDIEVDSPICVFPSKWHFDNYVYIHDLYEKILKLTSSPPCDHKAVILLSRQCYVFYKETYENKNDDNWYLVEWLHRFTFGYLCVKALEISIASFKAMKSNEYLEEAISILTSILNQRKYRQHKRALWYDEKALIFQSRFRQFEKAASVLKIALNETEISNDAKAPLRDRALRLALQKNINLPITIRQDLIKLSEEIEIDLPFIEISAKSVNDMRPGKKARYVFRDIISGDKIYSSVEDYALLHYINELQYTNGEHWEGRIIRSIFVLLFWDIIYSNTEKGLGVFLSCYQDAPLDLYTTAFYENRKNKIDSRLIDIETNWDSIDDIIEFMKTNYLTRKEGEVSLFDNNIEWIKIYEVSSCLGRHGISCICRRLSSNYQYASSGFPDLTVWNYDLKKIKFVEVKGDGDKLSNKQIQWMTYMLKYGVETEVCYVHKGNTKRSPKKTLRSINARNILEDNKQLKRKRRTNSKKLKEVSIKEVSEKNEGSFSDISLKHENSETSQSVKRFKAKSKIENEDLHHVSSSVNVPKIQSPKKSTNKSPIVSDCYLKSPTKFSRGVGYFVSPTKSSSREQNDSISNTQNANRTPTKSRSRLSLTLTRKRLFEIDT